MKPRIKPKKYLFFKIGWPWTNCPFTEVDLDFLMFLLSLPECWDYRVVYAVRGNEPRRFVHVCWALHRLSKLHLQSIHILYSKRSMFWTVFSVFYYGISLNLKVQPYSRLACLNFPSVGIIGSFPNSCIWICWFFSSASQLPP